MTAWLSVLVPLLVMFFALGMERVESRLRESTVRPEELEELLERPRPDEVRALFRQGTGRALELFRLRDGAAAHPPHPEQARCLTGSVRPSRCGENDHRDVTQRGLTPLDWRAGDPTRGSGRGRGAVQWTRF